MLKVHVTEKWFLGEKRNISGYKTTLKIYTTISLDALSVFLFPFSLAFPFHFYFIVFNPNMVYCIASYCCCTHALFQSVANMAARRSGSQLLRRCIFCCRETLKPRRDFHMRHFSRIGNALFVPSSRGGIFSASGENQLIPLVHRRRYKLNKVKVKLIKV